MATNVCFFSPWAALKIQSGRHFGMSQVHELLSFGDCG